MSAAYLEWGEDAAGDDGGSRNLNIPRGSGLGVIGGHVHG